jgi:hypothetical protein
MASRIGKLYSRLPALLKGGIWATFFIGTASYSVLLIRDGLNGNSETALPEPVLSVTMPVPARAEQQTAANLSRTEYQQLLKAEQGLDSLKQICPACYHQLLLAHPGFQDSLRHIIRVYQNEVKQPSQTNQP